MKRLLLIMLLSIGWAGGAQASVSVVSAGAAANGTTSVAVPYPASLASGDMLIMGIVNRGTSTEPTTPSGWTKLRCLFGVSGAGVDAGGARTTIYTKVASGSESGTLNVSVSSGSSAIGAMVCFRKTLANWDVVATAGRDETAGTSWSVAGVDDIGLETGDICLTISGINTDDYTYSSEAATCSGVTFGSLTEHLDAGTTQGNDLGLVISSHPVTAGTSAGVPAFTMTASGSAANAPCGSTVIIRIRDVAANAASRIASFRYDFNNLATTEFNYKSIKGLGPASDIKALLWWGNYAGPGEDGSAVNSARFSMGFWTPGEGQFCTANRFEHNATSVPGGLHGHMDSSTRAYLLAKPHSSVPGNSIDSSGTLDSYLDGGWGQKIETVGAKATYINGLAFAGSNVQAKIYQPTISTDLNGTVDQALTFEPKLCVVIITTDNFDEGTGHVGMCPTTFAFVSNNKAGTVKYAAQTNSWKYATTAKCYGQVADNCIPVFDSANNDTATDWKFTVSFPDASTMRVTTTKVGVDAAYKIYILALDFSDLAVDVGILSTPTSTGSASLTGLALTPKAMCLGVNHFGGTNTDSINNAIAGVTGLACAARGVGGGETDSCATIACENGATTTNTQSLNDDQFIDCTDHDGGTTGDVLATLTSLDAGGFTANYTAVNASAYKWPWFAIGASTAKPLPPFLLNQ